MDKTLGKLLRELEQEGTENDAQASTRDKKMLNITHDTGQFLSLLIKATQTEQILEIGTSNGYSTLWLADALPETGSVTTVEMSAEKIRQASINFKRAGLEENIVQVQKSAGDFFESLDKQYDFIFLDAERVEYMNFVTRVITALKPGAVLVCDNAISHAEELKDFIYYIENHPDFNSCTVPVGKGEFVAYKNRHSIKA
ncbi:MAG: O-methyltransferase [Cellvibrionaceae bacterium]